MAHGRQDHLLALVMFRRIVNTKTVICAAVVSVNATACRAQEKEQVCTYRRGASKARKLLLVKIENSQLLTSQSRAFLGGS